MRGEKIYKILDLLEDGAMSFIDLHVAIFSSPYGASFGRLDYEHKKREKRRHNYQVERSKKRAFQSYLANLKNQGFILEDKNNGKISITNLGKVKLKTVKQKVVLNKNHYKKEPGQELVIISYDLPVIYNKERAILREILKMLGFNLIHKSVWIGKVNIPKDFIVALNRMNITKFVEIMEVTKSGTIKTRSA